MNILVSLSADILHSNTHINNNINADKALFQWDMPGRKAYE